MRPACLLVLVLLPLLASCPASATSYVPVTDEALVDQAPVIALVKTLDSGSDGARPATLYRVRIERVVKGAMAPGSVIQVRVPGGIRKDGIGLQIWGAPRFKPGERAVLFLSPRLDGSYDIVHLMLGAFHERAKGHHLALRDLTEASAVVRPGESVPRELLRDFDRFVEWIARRARGLHGQADYEVAAAPGIDQITDSFTLFKAIDGLNMRWFDFDQQQNVEWLAHQDGQQGMAGGGFTEFQTALAAWNNETGTNIDYTFGGTTTDTSGLVSFDSVNAILFNDPNNEISAFSCSSGGVLAIGGPWFDSAGVPYRGTFIHPIVNADIVTNNGIACFFQSSPNAGKAAEELFAHELGHTLGFGHSALSEALMRSSVHDDGRGALLHDDDRAAAAALYTPLSPPTDFFTLTPCRLLDTRNPNGPLGGPALQGGLVRTFSAAGQCGIPSTAISLSANVTVVGPTGTGFLTLFPAHQLVPGTTSLNFSGGQIRGNNAILHLSPTPEQAFTVLPGLAGAAHLIVDVNGWFE